MNKIFFLLIVIILFVSCEPHNSDDHHPLITVVNKTDDVIYVNRSYDYPNTDAYKTAPNPALGGYNKVGANATTNEVLPTFGTAYEYIYKDLIPSGIMMIYVFDGPTLETKGWDYIKQNNLVLKRYDLKLTDLENMNWTITYDGK